MPPQLTVLVELRDAVLARGAEDGLGVGVGDEGDAEEDGDDREGEVAEDDAVLAGDGEGGEDQEDVGEDEDGEEDDEEVRFRLNSDVMFPAIMPGAIVTYDPLRTHLQDGQMYVFSFDNAMQVRRIQKLRNGGIMLLTDNKAYLPQEVTQKELVSVDVLGAVSAVTNFYR